MDINKSYSLNTNIKLTTMVYYAVANGRKIGICLNWKDCSDSVKGYKNARYKKFDTKEEAEYFISSYKQIKISKDKSKGKGKIDINDNDNDNDFSPDYYVYTDGACSNNGRDNALTGIGIFFGICDKRNVSKKLEGKQTNNIAELTAIMEAYLIIEKDIKNGKKIAIVSDSEYAIKCVTSYGEKCDKKQWKMDIPNKKLVQTVYEMYKDKSNIRFFHVKAHTNNTDIHSIGNMHADKLANLAIGEKQCPYEKKINKK